MAPACVDAEVPDEDDVEEVAEVDAVEDVDVVDEDDVVMEEVEEVEVVEVVEDDVAETADTNREEDEEDEDTWSVELAEFALGEALGDAARDPFGENTLIPRNLVEAFSWNPLFNPFDTASRSFSPSSS